MLQSGIAYLALVVTVGFVLTSPITQESFSQSGRESFAKLETKIDALNETQQPLVGQKLEPIQKALQKSERKPSSICNQAQDKWKVLP